MGDTGFRVQPDLLGRYSALLSEQAEQLERIQAATASITISAEAFGHLPNAQNLAQVYQDHADAGRQNLSTLGEAMTGTADGLGQVAQDYAESDRMLSAGLGGGQ